MPDIFGVDQLTIYICHVGWLDQPFSRWLLSHDYPPSGIDIFPNMESKKDHKKQHGSRERPYIRCEHVAFFCFWLNAVVFCSRSVTMQRLYQPFAALIHKSESTLCLSKLLLNVVFEKFMKIDGIPILARQPIEVICLASLKSTFSGPKIEDLSWAVFTKFYHANSFQNKELNFTPLSIANMVKHGFK
ncbi:hypothetical protein AHAS_Ahas02G0119400 [Arachis hypogaea]